MTILGVVLLASWAFGWRLGVKPLENWDEGIHAEVSRETVASGSWWSLTYRDHPYLAKPPLAFWLRSATMLALGPSELAIRLWSAVAGVLTAALLALWAWQVSGSVRFSALAATLFVVGRFTLFHAFRTGETDGLLLPWFVGALYAYWRSRHDRRWWMWFGLAVGLAVMTKSVAGLLPVVIVALDLTLARRWRAVGWRPVLTAALIGLAVAVPWHLEQTIVRGGSFWSSYIGFHVLERTSEVLYANNVGWTWYVEVAFKRLFPFGLLAAVAMLQALRRAIRERDGLDRLLLIWIGAVFLAFSFVRTKFDWYLLPLYPAVVFVTARGLSEFFHRSGSTWLRLANAAALAGTVAILPLGLAHNGALWRATPFGWMPDWFADAWIGRMVISVGVVVVLTVIAWWLRRRARDAVRLVGIAATVWLAVLAIGWYGSYLRHLPTSSPFKDVAVAVEQTGTRQLDVLDVSLLTQPAGNFYLRRIPGLTVHEVRIGDRLDAPYLLTTELRVRTMSVARPFGDAILERSPYLLFRRDTTP